MSHSVRQWLHHGYGAPEPPVALFGFLLNFLWEMWQIPFFEGMTEAWHWDVVWLCTRASLGDTGILLAAYWLAAWAGGRAWILTPRILPTSIYIGLGLAVTVSIEYLSTEVLDRWSYVESTGDAPLPGVSAPLIQWLLLPPLVQILSRYHLLGVMYAKGLRRFDKDNKDT